MKVKDLKTNVTYDLVSYKATHERQRCWMTYPTSMGVDISMRLDQVIYSVSYTKNFGDPVRFEITNDKGEVIQL